MMKKIMMLTLLTMFVITIGGMVQAVQQPSWPVRITVTPSVLQRNTANDITVCWYYEGPGDYFSIESEKYFDVTFDHSLGTLNSIGTSYIKEASDFNGSSGGISVPNPIAIADFTILKVNNKIKMEYEGMDTKQLKYASAVCTPANITTPNEHVDNFARFVANVTGMSGKPQLTPVTVQ